MEISAGKVMYQKESDPEKHYSSMERSNVNVIHYANGSYDVFQNPADSASQTATVNGYNLDPQNNSNNSGTPSTYDPAYNRKIARNQAVIEAAYFGLRVLGFACRVALEIALQSHSHDNSFKSSNSGTYHKRGQ